MKRNTGKKYTVQGDELNVRGGGIYCYMPFEELDAHNKALFKIGLAIDFNKRLENYHTYFPLGLYMVAFFANPPVPMQLRGQKRITKKMHYQTIEKFIFNYVSDHGGNRIYSTTRVRNPNAENVGETEWIYTTVNSIHEAFHAAWKKFGGNEPMIFNLEGINKTAKANEKKLPSYVGRIVYPIS